MRALAIGLGALLWLFVVTSVIRPLARAYRLSQRHLRRAAERAGLWLVDAPYPWHADVEPPAPDQIRKITAVRESPILLHGLGRRRFPCGVGCWGGARSAWRIELAEPQPARTIPYAEGDSNYLGMDPGELEKRCSEVRFVEVRSAMIWLYFAVFLLVDLVIVAWGVMKLDEWTP